MSALDFSTGEPLADICACSICGWSGKVEGLETKQDGDWESGYFKVHLCPKCKDGGCIDDYSMSKKRIVEWEKWNIEQSK
jgi:hypothetical protein